MSSSEKNSERKKVDYFEAIVWTAASIIVAMLAAHYWLGLY